MALRMLPMMKVKIAIHRSGPSTKKKKSIFVCPSYSLTTPWESQACRKRLYTLTLSLHYVSPNRKESCLSTGKITGDFFNSRKATVAPKIPAIADTAEMPCKLSVFWPAKAG
jgi:hypothetical protein